MRTIESLHLTDHKTWMVSTYKRQRVVFNSLLKTQLQQVFSGKNSRVLRSIELNSASSKALHNNSTKIEAGQKPKVFTGMEVSDSMVNEMRERKEAKGEEDLALESDDAEVTSSGQNSMDADACPETVKNIKVEDRQPSPANEAKSIAPESINGTISSSVDEETNFSQGSETGGESLTRNNSNNSNITSCSMESSQSNKSMADGKGKKPWKRGSKKKKKPVEMLQCIICGHNGLSSEFCASGRFCSQRCVGAYASKCRADTLAAAAAAGEIVEPRKRKRQKKDGSKKGPKGVKKKNHSYGKHARLSAEYHDVMSPGFSPFGNEDVKPKKAKLSMNDDAHFFYSAVGKEKPFDWELYLSIVGKESVPVEVFEQENIGFEVFPPPATAFKAGMKLEAVDPRHPSCLCVVSVVETQGARLRLHFDGWSESYDFWTNSDSHLLFPVGFCKSHDQKLNCPRGVSSDDFDWDRYLDETKSEAAPRHLFREVPPTTHGFTTNMKLEAIDKKNPDLTCVASINNVIGDYFLVHFDEWDDTYDYWCRETCPYLHPVGWCKEIGIRLTPPQDDQVDTFDWKEYLEQTNTIAVPAELLKQRKPTNYKAGQKLEVVDPRNPSLVRVATIALIDEFQLKIHFDGWDNMYDFWFDSESNDLHPVGWCNKTGHQLEPPPSFLDAQDTTLCPTPGCRGIGHVKGAKYTTHHSIFGCPYSPANVSRGSPLVDRLANNSMGEEPSISGRVYNCKSPKEDIAPDSTTKADLIKQQKLLKGIVGRPAKKASDKPSPKSPKFFPKGFPKLAMKDKSKITKKSLYSPRDGISPSPKMDNVSSTSCSDATKPIMRTSLPIIKVMNTNKSKLKFESSQIKDWSVREVAQFIRSIGLVDHAFHFEEQQIDGEALLLLSQADMIRHLKIKLGPALKIANAITKAV